MDGATLRVRVARKWAEAQDVCGLEFVAADGGALPPFPAGAHVDVHLPGGLVRPYSLCNDPAETHRYRIAVLREAASRGGSAAVHEALREGDELTLSAPRQHFALDPGATRSLLLAGGIGITPILSMAEQLAATGADFTLHYAARSPRHMAFRERLAEPRFASRVHLAFSEGPQARRLDLGAVLAAPQPGTQLYVCGPQRFIDAVLETARAAGWPGQALHWERFAGSDATPRADDGAFDVRLARSGRTIRIAADRTVTQALAEAGVEILVSCEQGVCGTCLTRVLDGECEHRDEYLTPEEQAAHDQFTPCCSRAKSATLVLDL